MLLEFLILVLAPPRNAIQSSSLRPPLYLYISTLPPDTGRRALLLAFSALVAKIFREENVLI